MSHTIAAAIIAGPSVKREGKEDFNRCLKSLEGYVDIAFIAYNCPDEGLEPLPDDLPELSYKVMMRHFTWDDDFSKSRNDSYQMVHDYMLLSQKHYEWILWIDTDDTLEGGEHLQELIDELDPNTQGVFLRYDYAVDPDTDTVLAVQWRERLMRTDAKFVWHYPIHEICHAPPGTQFARKGQVWIRHWRMPKADNAAIRERNRRLLTQARKLFPDEPRFKYYFANEVYAEASIMVHEGRDGAEKVIDAGIKAYEEFIPDAPSPDDAYMAAHQIAELRRMKNDAVGAIEAELQAMMIHPSWPDAYVGIAQAYMETQDFAKQEFWARACLQNCAPQETSQVREPLNNEYLPRLLLGIALEEQGQLDEARVEYERIAEWNLTPEIDERLDAVAVKLDDLKNYVDDGDVLKDVRRQLFSSQKEKSIAFFTRPLFEQWHPNLSKEGGIGGAETCVMEVAKRFRAEGWRVAVFGTPGIHRGVGEDGIEWWHADDFITTEEFTIFVSSRCPEVFDNNIKAKLRLLWMHDVNVGDSFDGPFGPRGDNIDFVIGLTDWHITHLRRLYGIPENKMIQVPNGVDLERFNRAPSPRQKHKFVWSSSPDRGLDVLLNLWPTIKHRWNDAELHVFYGWQAIDKIIELTSERNPLFNFRKFVKMAIEELGGEAGGIFWHDRVQQDKLAKELMTCDMWLYPTYFNETFCITAIEAQAAGVIPLTSDVGALRETVSRPQFRVEGWPNNATFQQEYIKRLSVIQEDMPVLGDKWRQEGIAHAHSYSWDNAFLVWKEIANAAIQPEVILS